jgi:hypothetical protein
MTILHFSLQKNLVNLSFFLSGRKRFPLFVPKLRFYELGCVHERWDAENINCIKLTKHKRKRNDNPLGLREPDYPR